MNSPTTEQGSAAKWLLLLFVRFYQIFLSPFLGGACKFYPSCSRYAQEAIEMHGAQRGAWLAMKRLGRCRPFTKGGFDPVPEVMDEKEFEAELVGAENNRARGTSAVKQFAEKAESVPQGLPDKMRRDAQTAKAPDGRAASMSELKLRPPKNRAFEYGDADWLRTAGKERAQ
jgi:hypothetical protein